MRLSKSCGLSRVFPTYDLIFFLSYIYRNSSPSSLSDRYTQSFLGYWNTYELGLIYYFSADIYPSKFVGMKFISIICTLHSEVLPLTKILIIPSGLRLADWITNLPSLVLVGVMYLLVRMNCRSCQYFPLCTIIEYDSVPALKR